MSVVVPLERTVLLDLCTEGAKLGGRSRKIFRSLYLEISKLPSSPEEALFSAARHSSLKKGAMSASDFFYKKFIKGYSEDQLSRHLCAMDTKISKMSKMLARLIDKTPWLVLERAAVSIVLDKKQNAFAVAEVASVTKVDTQFKEYEKKQADKRKLADEEAELLLAGLGQEEADRDAEAAAAEEAWRDVCVQQGMDESPFFDSDEEKSPEQSPRPRTPAQKKKKANMSPDEPSSIDNLAEPMQDVSIQS